MKTILLINLFFITCIVSAQNLDWAKSMGGSTDDRGKSIAVDAGGNVYTTGYFRGTVDFDPGPATSNLTSSGTMDIFISKLNAAGNLIWAKNIGGTSTAGASAIALDASANIYITGEFRDTVDFDPGVPNLNIASAGEADVFIVKLDSAGNLDFAKTLGGKSNDAGFSIAVDGTGNIFSTGIFQDTADFDPGVNIFDLITYAWDKNIFVLKLDASGNFVWAKSFGEGDDDYGNSIALDAAGNIYTTGFFQATVDFDPDTSSFSLTSSGNKDIFVLKLDASGKFIWAKAMGGADEDYGSSVALDGDGNIYTTGFFYAGPVDFDPDSAGIFNLYSAGNSDGFVSKLNTDGNFVWVKALGTSVADAGNSITTGTDNNVYVTGHNATSIFISKLDTAGILTWTKTTGGPSYNNIGYGVAVDAYSNVYATGYFQGTSDFDPGPGIFNITTAGVEDIFILKLGTLTGLPEEISENGFSAYPNPASDLFTLHTEKFLKSASLTVYNSEGQIVKELKNIDGQDVKVSCEKLPCGLYFVRVENERIVAKEKVMVNR